ncbi:MAG: zinc metallopeptidase [Clostridia bacterium]|nr:zinc metallopeptidase [Clostridia bacterium]
MPLLKDLEQFKNVSPALQWAIFIVAALIALLAVVSLCVSVWLFFKYIRFNRKKNSANLSGGEVARKILDNNGLKNIRVSTFGSFLFGNSYSHYFHKVRLRRLTCNKKSVTSLAMGAQKSSLAILDKNGDKDMKKRVLLTPLIFFGPVAFIPIVAVGVAVDYFMFNFTGVWTIIAAAIGFFFYLISFVLSIMVLKTEVKAQKLACEILKKENLATSDEVEDMKELFKLYNIQYVNDIIMEFLQLVLRVLTFIAKMQNNSSSSGD